MPCSWRMFFIPRHCRSTRDENATDELRERICQRYERLRTQQREAERQAEHLFQTLLHRAFRGSRDRFETYLYWVAAVREID